MVLEQIVSVEWLKRKPLFSLFLGFIYTLVGSATSYLFFKEKIALASLFLITLLLVPSLISLLSTQEKIERRQGLRNFFVNHKDIFSIYLYLAIGVFIGYLVVAWLLGMSGTEITFSEQIKVLGSSLTEGKIYDFSGQGWGQAVGIFTVNVGVAVVFFILSFFYGAGAIFLIVWNASIFSTFIILALENLSRGTNYSVGLLGTFFIYIIPEIGGFLLAGIAGGVISKALITEEFLSSRFRNVVKDATILLLLSFLLLILASFLESFVATGLVKTLVFS